MPSKAPDLLVTLKKRSEFLRIRGGARYGAAAFLMEARARPRVVAPSRCEASEGGCQDSKADTGADFEKPELIDGARFGLTVTKKIGNAVVRNRVRRRLREALRAVAPSFSRLGCDYVLVARPAALTQQFSELGGDLKKAFQRINSALDRPARRGQAKSRRTASQ